jgi:hypothetical protein
MLLVRGRESEVVPEARGVMLESVPDCEVVTSAGHLMWDAPDETADAIVGFTEFAP